MRTMKVTIFGTGYVGLVQGAIFANAGHDVLCVDICQEKVEQLKKGCIPFYEPGLKDLILRVQEKGLLRFTTNARDGVHHSNLQFIAVGTPSNENGHADLTYVLTVAESIATYMDSYQLVINKSTVPIGTADLVKEKVSTILAQRKITLPFDVASNPEFLKEGSAVSDCQQPDRIVIGTDSAKATELLLDLYHSWVHDPDKIILMDIRSAELTKYAANCMLATKISFINEMANLAEKCGADIQAVRNGIGTDPRIGHHFIVPGAGYGGSCFPKDVRALIRTAEQIGYDPQILKAVEARNTAQKEVLFQKMLEHFNHQLADKVVALWGLAFKPNTSDMREAASGVLIKQLLQVGVTVQAFDPVAAQEAHSLYGHHENFKIHSSKESALQNADFLAIITEWREFYEPDFTLMHNTLKQPIIFDGRNLYDPADMAKKGFIYKSIGR